MDDENLAAHSHSGRIIGYCFLGVIPFLLCLLLVILRRKSPRPGRLDSQPAVSSVHNRWYPASGPAGSGRNSRRKTLSPAALDEIPLYRKTSHESARCDSLDLENGTTCEGINNSNSNATCSADVAVQDFALCRLNSMHSSSASINSTCAICTEDFKDGQFLRNLPCHHKYHAKCIDSWLLDKATSCPLWYVQL
ncbi:hypothetical protein BJX76DRAFT_178991 [Aspergillus varians]